MMIVYTTTRRRCVYQSTLSLDDQQVSLLYHKGPLFVGSSPLCIYECQRRALYLITLTILKAIVFCRKSPSFQNAYCHPPSMMMRRTSARVLFCRKSPSFQDTYCHPPSMMMRWTSARLLVLLVKNSAWFLCHLILPCCHL